MNLNTLEHPALSELLSIMKQLRDPETGCPWDLEQDFASIVPHTLEEAYEVAEAIEQGDWQNLKSELGDLLFQVVFYAQLAKEADWFDFEQVMHTLNEKLVRRHPHVFAESKAGTHAELKVQWQAIKEQERASQGKQPETLFSAIPIALPALTRADKIQKKVSTLGFDWPEVSGALEKVKEEVLEVEDELAADPFSDKTAEEIGDLLFAVVNVARHCKRDPEQLLRQANLKFSQRFEKVEHYLLEQGLAIEQASLEQMDSAWEQVKRQEVTKT
ncbi:ATP diphosphatase [Pseudoalteromonas ulvae UL12]|uniref:nucleoside triphosphate pyrophosphohydrolase n=1 Tax=Pseudoalteromonas ulvae TaxID=107327 RepID=UPI0019EE76BA|nr:nucleoside triphosphate pyrophosphohydrolase [Pseudoalteromonas ulvae]MBE0363782.1 ATP diphosphatase [Pseudoalteromonas ulvae UL12]